MPDIPSQVSEMWNKGASVDATIKMMHDSGMTITEAIKAARELFAVDLGVAKQMVSAHTAWSNEVHAGSVLHDELIRASTSREAGGGMA